MNATLRRTASLVGVAAAVALACAGAASTALSLNARRETVADLSREVAALQARQARLAPRADLSAKASPMFEAKTVTLAGAALQQRLEAAIATARGRLLSSKVELSPRDDERRVSLAADLTIAEPDLQTLLFDLETGRPYLFVDSIEARSPELAGQGEPALRVSLLVSGRWSGAK